MANATPPAELLQPGVEVLQTFSAPAPSFVRPTLAPVVVGVAFEVTEVLNTDGTINSGDLFGTYAQLGKNIAESSFPAPRGNIAELVVQANTVRPFLFEGSQLHELVMRPLGSGFLQALHGAGKAAINTAVFNGGTGLAIQGLTLVLSIDNPARLDTTDDVAITFTGSGNLTSAQAAAQINAAIGATVATVLGTAPSDYVQIASERYGALSSVTVRAGASANTLLQIGYSSGSPNHEERIEGSGWRGQDQQNNTTQTQWIEFYVGAYILDGTSTSFVSKVGMIDIIGQTFISAAHSAVTFGSSGTVPILPGDYFYADGVKVNNGEIAKVESARFKIGTINPALSTVDSNGNYITKVYNITTVGTLFDPNPFAPMHAYFIANGIDWTVAAPVSASILGSVLGTAATPGSVIAVGGSFPMALTGLTLHTVTEINGVLTDSTFTFTGSDATIGALITTLTGQIPGVTPLNSGGQLELQTNLTGATQAVTVKKDGTANATLGFSTSADTTGTGTDVVFSGLAGQNLQFTMDNNPHIHTASFSTTSLVDAINEINAVVGATVASAAGTGNRALLLTSILAGQPGSVSIIVQTSEADTTFGVRPADTPTLTAGAGRPLPDAYLDVSGILHVNSELIRDLVTGFPLDQQFNTAPLYIQYTALRLDVTASAPHAAVIRVSDPTTLGTVLNPLTDANPLGLAAFLCMINAPSFEIKLLGIDEITAAAPTGTGAAWARAAALLEAEEVYAIAPLTQDQVIMGLWETHVTVMSSPEQGGERIVFINPVVPTRQNPTVALSGNNANSTSTPNQMLLDGNPIPGLVAAGINPALPIPESAGVYMTFEVNGAVVNYNVSNVAGALVTFRTTFSLPATNADGFYTTATLSSSVIDAAYSLDVRGASLVIPGTNPPLPDFAGIADTVALANQSIKNRRVYSIFPDLIDTTVNGLEKQLPGYYAAAAIVGMVAAQPPQQGFTNFPITGLTGVDGTQNYKRSQLNIMAGGGTYILQQEVPGGAVTCRHQLSTDLTSIETRELSITKVIDFVAKFLRASVRKFIGVNNVNPDLLNTLGTTIHAILQFLQEVGVLNGSNLNNIAQDTSNPDTVLVDVTLDVPFPCNYIRLTLVV